MERLEYIARELPELIKLAREAGDHMLAYLLEMALAEAVDEMSRRRRPTGTP